MSKYIVYALLCPKCGCPRYVGQSSYGIKRLQEHMRGKKCKDNCIHKKRWVQSLLDQNLKPSYVVLLELPTADELDVAEVFWIAEMRRRGCPLTNLTGGGGGLRGYKQTPEVIEKRVKHFRGVPKSSETKAKISAALKGRPQPWAGQPISPARQAALDRLHAVPPFQDQHGRVYKTIKEAADRWGIPPGNIVHCLKGRRKSAGGLMFSYMQ